MWVFVSSTTQHEGGNHEAGASYITHGRFADLFIHVIHIITRRWEATIWEGNVSIFQRQHVSHPQHGRQFRFIFFHPKLLDDSSAPSRIDQTADLLDSQWPFIYERGSLDKRDASPTRYFPFVSFHQGHTHTHIQKKPSRDNQLSSTTLRGKERRIEERVDRSFLPPDTLLAGEQSVLGRHIDNERLAACLWWTYWRR